MKKIRINLPDNPYDVLIGKGISQKFRAEFIKRNLSENLFIVIDSNVKRKQPGKVKLILPQNTGKGLNYFFKSHEKNKSYETLLEIHKRMITGRLGRSCSVIALGGGIVGDVTGFAASTYMRGVNYIQVPTTLLSAVDSSVGGKTGINFNDTKNIIGSFCQPKLVLIDTEFFTTLPKEEILCGVGELVKYAFIVNEKFYNYLNKNIEKVLTLDNNVIQRLISDSVSYKGAVVAADEKESGLRKVLNFGHTFAHAVEIEQNYKIKHGQAVIVGIACALHLSHKSGLISEDDLKRHLVLINKFADKIKIGSYNKKLLYSIMMRDKKNRNGRIKFVLLKNVGEILLDVEADKNDVYYALEKGLNVFTK